MQSVTRAQGRQWWLRLIPCAALDAVALAQIVLARAGDLSPWYGGGFGMFSTTDAGRARHLHAFQLRPGLEREIAPPPALEDRVRRTLTLPTDRRLRALARDLAELPVPDYGPAQAVRVEVWRTGYDPETLAPASRILRALTVPVGDR